MTSTLTAHAHAAAPEGSPADAPLFDTMRALVQYRSERRPVPGHLLDDLRTRRLETLVGAIEHYNARMQELGRRA